MVSAYRPNFTVIHQDLATDFKRQFIFLVIPANDHGKT